MRRAEIIASVVLAVLSLYFMWKSTELPIGWIPERGPGGGAFPFWLSLGMLISCVVIFIQAIKGQTPESRSDEKFLKDEIKKPFFLISCSLVIMVGLIHVVGIYISIPLYMIFYLRYMGKHSWVTTLSLSAATPVVTFLFFEKLLLILLPKGITEEWFYIFF